VISPLLLGLVLVASPAPSPPAVQWEYVFDEAIARARAGRKPLMVDFNAAWCTWCKRLDATTYADPAVVSMARDFVAVKVDAETPAGRKIALDYDVLTLPTILFLAPSGRPILRVAKFEGPGQFPETLRSAASRSEKVMSLEAALDKDPLDAASLAALGFDLWEQEFYKDSQDLLERAKVVDDKRPSAERKRTRTILAAIRRRQDRFGEAESLLREALALKPAGDYDAKTLYVLGRTYLRWGRNGDARTAFQTILDSYAKSSMAEKAREALVTMIPPEN